MLVLIDESGDPGFKTGRGSSAYFVIAAVIFDDSLEAEKTAVGIKLLRRELNLPDYREFHFHGSSMKLKQAFMERVAQENFRVRAIVFDKAKLYSEEFKTNQASFYNFAIKLLLKDERANIRNASVKLDGRGDRQYKKGAGSYLRQQLNTKDNRVIEKFKFVDSQKDVLIQLADMVSGAIYRSFQPEKTDASLYRGLIEPRIENIWLFR